MADDLGWGNVGFHNSEDPLIHTPNMDSLVANGLELTRHYVSPLCSPSRSAFQSGRLPVHVNQLDADGLTSPTHGIPAAMTGIATKLRASPAAYSTHLVGKWDCGLATYAQLPTAKQRGYDSFYGFLGDGVDYFEKTSTSTLCTDPSDTATLPLSDFWEDDVPVDMADLADSDYSELLFAERVMDLLDDVSSSSNNNPFFIVWASHLPRAPFEVPSQHRIASDLWNDDTSQCCASPLNDCEVDGEGDEEFACRAMLQSQVNLLDAMMGDVVSKLKANALWDDTLLILTTDSGASLDLAESAGNNFPLRGGKGTAFEGGIRATTFVSGGYLPQQRRGEKEQGMLHIADWYATLIGLSGAESASDSSAVKYGLPDVDSVDMWPLLSGATSVSPRTELVVSDTVLFSGAYKLMTGTENYAVWNGPSSPNASSPSAEELAAATQSCEAQGGCLFNVEVDAGEHHDLSATLEGAEMVSVLSQRLKELSGEFYSNDREGLDSCPASVMESEAEEGQKEECGCWMAVNNYAWSGQSVVGPYQDLSESEQAWRGSLAEGVIGQRREVLSEEESGGMTHLLIVIVICACSAVIVAASMYYCYRWDRSISKRKLDCKGSGQEREALLDCKGYGAVDKGKSPIPTTDLADGLRGDKVVRIRGTL